MNSISSANVNWDSGTMAVMWMTFIWWTIPRKDLKGQFLSLMTS